MKNIILCFDNNPKSVNSICTLLQKEYGKEYTIEACTNSVDAIGYFNELKKSGFTIPLIISNCSENPQVSCSLINEVHKVDPETKIILLVAKDRLSIIKSSLKKVNLYRFITLPWDIDDMHLTIFSALKSWNQIQEIKTKNKELAKLNSNLENLVMKRTRDLAEANATKDKFFSIIAHDLKSSFNSLIGFSDILLSDFEELEDSDKLRFIAKIKNLSENTYKLLQNLLEWSRMQTGRITYKPEIFDLYTITKSVLRLQKSHANSKNIQLVSTIMPGLKVFADINMTSTILRNICSNAIKFTEPGGEVILRAEKEHGYVKVEIEDSGIGIDNEEINNLFQISKRVKTFGTAMEEGTGLGLILCKEFIDLNKGQIHVESKKGEGSKFTISLPKDPNGMFAKN